MSVLFSGGRFVSPYLATYPRTCRGHQPKHITRFVSFPCPIPIFPFFHSHARKARDIQPSHARMSHEIGHAIDYDDGRMLLSVAVKRGDQPSRVFSIHDMNGENHFRSLHVSIDLAPLIVTHWRAKVVSRNLQIEIKLAIDLALRLFQGRQQTRAYVKYGD